MSDCAEGVSLFDPPQNLKGMPIPKNSRTFFGFYKSRFQILKNISRFQILKNISRFQILKNISLKNIYPKFRTISNKSEAILGQESFALEFSFNGEKISKNNEFESTALRETSRDTGETTIQTSRDTTMQDTTMQDTRQQKSLYFKFGLYLVQGRDSGRNIEVYLEGIKQKVGEFNHKVLVLNEKPSLAEFNNLMASLYKRSLSLIPPQV